MTFSTFADAANWPQFRGPTGQGLSDESRLPLTWGGGTNGNVIWKSPLRGQGHASPIIWADSVFTCTVEWPADTADRTTVIPDHYVNCYRVRDGSTNWSTRLPPGPWLRTDFRSGAGGGYAGPTPATDGEHIFCTFGSSVIAALDFKGNIVWRKDIVPFTFDVTLGSSPVLYEDSVILFCAMAKTSDSCVIAFNKNSGEEKWRTPLPEMSFGHSTPLIIRVDDKPQLLVLASGMSVKNAALRSLDPTKGKLLWTCRGGGDAASPAFGAGIVYFDSGRGGPGFAVDPTGSGDVSQTHVRWNVNQVPEGIGSPIIISNYVYRLHIPGILKCWDAATGRQIYAERLEGLSSTWASPIADASGRIYFANGGKSYVIQSGPEFRVLAVNDLGDANHASAAAANGKLFIVGLKSIWCIGEKHER